METGRGTERGEGAGMGVRKGSGTSSSRLGKLDFQVAWLQEEESGEKTGGRGGRGSHGTESCKYQQRQPRQLWSLHAVQLCGSHQNQHLPSSHPLPQKV